VSEDWTDVLADRELGEGKMCGVDLAGERVLLARVNGCLYAVGGLCTHQVAHLEDGWLEGAVVRCPRHAAGFDLATGAPLDPPADMPVEVYEVKAEGGRLRVRARRVGSGAG
jgi:nitrite reductase/ring-hydroxylating ferredoxin subunit